MCHYQEGADNSGTTCDEEEVATTKEYIDNVYNFLVFSYI